MSTPLCIRTMTCRADMACSHVSTCGNSSLSKTPEKLDLHGTPHDVHRVTRRVVVPQSSTQGEVCHFQTLCHCIQLAPLLGILVERRLVHRRCSSGGKGRSKLLACAPRLRPPGERLRGPEVWFIASLFCIVPPWSAAPSVGIRQPALRFCMDRFICAPHPRGARTRALAACRLRHAASATRGRYSSVSWAGRAAVNCTRKQTS